VQGRPSVRQQQLHQGDARQTGRVVAKEGADLHELSPDWSNHVGGEEPPRDHDRIAPLNLRRQECVDTGNEALSMARAPEPTAHAFDRDDGQVGMPLADQLQHMHAPALAKDGDAGGKHEVHGGSRSDDRDRRGGTLEPRASAPEAHGRDKHELVHGDGKTLEVAHERMVGTEQHCRRGARPRRRVKHTGIEMHGRGPRRRPDFPAHQRQHTPGARAWRPSSSVARVASKVAARATRAVLPRPAPPRQRALRNEHPLSARVPAMGAAPHSVRARQVGVGSPSRAAGAPLTARVTARRPSSRSIGMGKATVVFWLTPISVSVCR
jgi:hypothetical protein